MRTENCPPGVFVGCIGGSANGVLPHPEGLIVSYAVWGPDPDAPGWGEVVLVDRVSGHRVRRLHKNMDYVLQPYDISPDNNVVVAASPREEKAPFFPTDGSSSGSSFRADPDLSFCGDSEWIY